MTTANRPRSAGESQRASTTESAKPSPVSPTWVSSGRLGVAREVHCALSHRARGTRQSATTRCGAVTPGWNSTSSKKRCWATNRFLNAAGVK